MTGFNASSVINGLRVVYGFLLVGILIAALLPGDDAPEAFAWDKANHMFAFFVLAAGAKTLWPRMRAIRLAVPLIVFGGAIEVLQSLPIFHRDGDWHDLLADGIAVVAGLLAVRLLFTIPAVAALHDRIYRPRR